MNAAAYIRVSTEDQTEFSPDAQLRAIRKYCADRGFSVSDKHIFRDEGLSGRRASSRPQFMKMVAEAKSIPKPFDIILVHKFDRFARNREDSVIYKSLLRKQCGIKVISVTEQMEDDKFSIILESMLEAMAEYYECVAALALNPHTDYLYAGLALPFIIAASAVQSFDPSANLEIRIEAAVFKTLGGFSIDNVEPKLCSVTV